jgi:hypothetical protein
VATIRYTAEISGRIETAEGVFDVRRHDESALGDLRELRQTLTGSATVTWSDGATNWSAYRRTELLVMSRSRMPGTFPAGTIELSADGAPSLKRSASMTFDGSPIAQMLVSFDGQAGLVCRVDLQSPDDSSDCE